jgi:hypothetical protein
MTHDSALLTDLAAFLQEASIVLADRASGRRMTTSRQLSSRILGQVGALLARVETAGRARSLSEWDERDGPVLWWTFPLFEAPYCGTPNDLGHPVEIHTQDSLERRIAATCTVGGWPGYHTHWTPLPAPPAQRSEGA